MPDLAREPSMEDILASIKRIIAEDGAVPAPAPRVRRGPVEVPPPAPEQDEVLELTEPVAPATPPFLAAVPPLAAVPVEPVRDAPGPEPVAETPAATIVSDRAASASRQSLAALSAMVVTPAARRSG